MSITVRLRMFERDGVCAMAHVLVFYDDPSIAMLLAVICEEEGHAVTNVHSVEDALMVLRSSLHPVRYPIAKARGLWSHSEQAWT
jgi:hypothetical protein